MLGEMLIPIFPSFHQVFRKFAVPCEICFTHFLVEGAFPGKVVGETKPRGSYIFASCERVPLLVVADSSLVVATFSTSCKLFHCSPSNFVPGFAGS